MLSLHAPKINQIFIYILIPNVEIIFESKLHRRQLNHINESKITIHYQLIYNKLLKDHYATISRNTKIGNISFL